MQSSMRVLVTGTSGHLGEALVRVLRDIGYEVLGLDVLSGPVTTHVGSITNRLFVRRCMTGVQIVFRAATLHKSHVATHAPQEFIDTNLSGTLNLFEEAVTAGPVGSRLGVPAASIGSVGELLSAFGRHTEY